MHKVDVGGVKLNLMNEGEVRRVLVQRMVSGGKETILGMKRDPQFGPLLLCGLGGTYVEIFKDVVVRIAPITTLEAHQMIEQLKSSPILSGYRGAPPSDIDAIADCLERLSQLALDFPELHELDMNPLIVFEQGKGAAVVDARIFIS